MQPITETDLANYLQQNARKRKLPAQEVLDLLRRAGYTLTVKNRQLRDAKVKGEQLSAELLATSRRVTGDPRDALRFLDPEDLAEHAAGAAKMVIGHAQRELAESQQRLATLQKALVAANQQRPDAPEMAVLLDLANRLLAESTEEGPAR